MGDSKALLERLRAATDDPPGGTKKRKGKGKGKRGKKTMASDEESAEETSGDESDAPVIGMNKKRGKRKETNIISFTNLNILYHRMGSWGYNSSETRGHGGSVLDM